MASRSREQRTDQGAGDRQGRSEGLRSSVLCWVTADCSLLTADRGMHCKDAGVWNVWGSAMGGSDAMMVSAGMPVPVAVGALPLSLSSSLPLHKDAGEHADY